MRALQIPPLTARRRIRQGFTLIELLLVMVIIAVLAAIVVPRLTGRREQANHTAAIDQISNFKTSLNAYETDTGKFPATLQALITNPGDTGWKGPYLQSDTVPKDPWGHDYVYTVPGTNGKDYDIYSTGADGSSHVE
jgi:general secretion pathway protein G